MSADDQGQIQVQVIFLCRNPWLAEEKATVQFKENFWWLHPDWRPADYGTWRLEMSGDSGSLTGHFLFARDCVAEEFVPEMGTAVLLGSGLLGMASYAAVRRRSAWHWRRH